MFNPNKEIINKSLILFALLVIGLSKPYAMDKNENLLKEKKYENSSEDNLDNDEIVYDLEDKEDKDNSRFSRNKMLAIAVATGVGHCIGRIKRTW